MRRLRWWLHFGPNVTPAMRYLPPLTITLELDTSAFERAMRARW